MKNRCSGDVGFRKAIKSFLIFGGCRVTITSGLSGRHGTACAAKENGEEKDPERRIHVIDTLSAGPEIALLMEKAVSVMQTGGL